MFLLTCDWLSRSVRRTAGFPVKKTEKEGRKRGRIAMMKRKKPEKEMGGAEKVRMKKKRKLIEDAAK